MVNVRAVDSYPDIRQAIRDLRQLQKKAPDVIGQAGKIVAAWLITQGKMSLEDAGDLNISAAEISQYLPGSRNKPPTWAALARKIKEEKKKHSDGMKKWLHGTFNINCDYGYWLLRLEKQFGGTEIEKLPLNRVIYLGRMPKRHIEHLLKHGALETGQSIDQLKSMPAIEFRRLIYALKA